MWPLNGDDLFLAAAAAKAWGHNHLTDGFAMKPSLPVTESVRD
jgi:hypothetical protein